MASLHSAAHTLSSSALGPTRPFTVNWVPGSKVIIHPTVSNEEAEKIYGQENIEYAKPYLRFTTLKAEA